MAKDNAEKFEKLLISDEKLQAKLRAAADAYTGDKRDEKAIFDAVIRPLAEEAGLPFTFEEAKDYAVENREISLEEGDAAAGGDDPSCNPTVGNSGCIVIGCGDDTDVGYCDDILMDAGAGACKYIGIGLFQWT